MRRTHARSALIFLSLTATIASGCRVRSLPPREVTDPSFIGSSDLATGHWTTADDIVRALRPHWLANRGPAAIRGDPTGVQVRMDNMWLGGASALHNVLALDVVSMEFIDPVAAAGRWGGNFRDGVILIVGRPQDPPLSSGTTSRAPTS